MKKIIILSIVTVFIWSCGNQENASSVDNLIASKNTAELKNKRANLQADLAKIDAAEFDPQ